MYNRFAKMRHRYLREHRNGIYTGMFLDGKLEAHLKEIGEAAEEFFMLQLRQGLPRHLPHPPLYPRRCGGSGGGNGAAAACRIPCCR